MVVQSGQHRTALARRARARSPAGRACRRFRRCARRPGCRRCGRPAACPGESACGEPGFDQLATHGCRRRVGQPACPAVTWVAQRHSRQHPGASGIAGRNLREGDLDDLAAAAAERVEHGQGGRQPGQRVGDRVTDEFRSCVRGTDKTARNRGIVTECDAGGTLAVGAIAGDAQPDPAGAARTCSGPSRGGSARRAGNLDHHVGDFEQRPQFVAAEVDGVGQL